jgi:hypothetical protein
MVVDDMLNNVTDQVTKEEQCRLKKGKGSIKQIVCVIFNLYIIIVDSVNIQDNTNANAIKEESILVHEDDNAGMPIYFSIVSKQKEVFALLFNTFSYYYTGIFISFQSEFIKCVRVTQSWRKRLTFQ